MALVQSVRLTMKHNGVAPLVEAVQYDSDRILKMIVADAELASGSTATLMFTRSDGSFDEVSCTLVLADNAFTADITQALTQKGRTFCQLKVTTSSKVASTYTFVILVQPTTEGRVPINQEGYTIEDIQAFLEAVQTAAANIYVDTVHNFGEDPITNVHIISTNKWHYTSGSSNASSVIEIPAGTTSVKIEADNGSTVIAFLESYSTPVEDATPDFADGYNGRIAIADGAVETYSITSSMKYLYILRYNSSHVDNTAKVTFYNIVVDTTLTLPKVPADSKTVGDEISRIDDNIDEIEDLLPIRPYVAAYDGGTVLGNQTVNTICRVHDVTDITDLPEGVSLDGHVAWMSTVGSEVNKHQLLWVPYVQNVFQRIYRTISGTGSWADWQSMLSDYLDDELSIRPKLVTYSGGTLLGNQPVNTICRLYGQTGITDLPEGVDVASHIAWMYTFGTSTNRHQILFSPANNGFFQRLYRGGSWQSTWYGTTGAVDPNATESLKILCIGNSFNQDVFAYVPPIFKEILPNCELTIGLLYSDGASYDTHIKKYTRHITEDPDTHVQTQTSEYYSKWSLWTPESTAWSRESNTMTLKSALEYTDWDIVTTQDSSSHIADYAINGTKTYVVNQAHELMRIVQENAIKPVQFVGFAFVGRRQPYKNDPPTIPTYTNAQMTNYIIDATEQMITEAGFIDYFPIANAIGSARSNSTLAALGDEAGYTQNGETKGAHDLMYDNHLQNGIGDLICAYVIVLKLLEWTGHQNLGVYGSTFRPTAANIADIGAMNNNGNMCHGSSVGVTENNVRAAQEIATLAVRNPTEPFDCANIIVSVPAQNELIS